MKWKVSSENTKRFMNNLMEGANKDTDSQMMRVLKLNTPGILQPPVVLHKRIPSKKQFTGAQTARGVKNENLLLASTNKLPLKKLNFKPLDRVSSDAAYKVGFSSYPSEVMEIQQRDAGVQIAVQSDDLS